ncbi:MAG: P-type conjugative transfer protein TrbJ [Parasphingorhabdus sp.]|uniref:P-type conjugative transfer protein TrbJ n=1 Tax=Parasphingorhabdus sp. TaxID=2709688 RepID=UPI0030032DF4
MKICKFRTRCIALMAATALTVPVMLPAPAHAVIVYDPTNYAQNLLQATRALEQIRNQIQSLQNEAQSLLNEAANLKKLPKSVMADVDKSVQATQGLLKDAQRIAYDVQKVDEAFSKRYSQSSLTGSNAKLVELARERWSDSIGGFQDALRVQAGIVQSIDLTRAKTNDLITSSQGSAGALQAAQAGNQLQALQLKQLTDLTALLAANGRAQILDAAAKASAKAQAREQFKRFLGSENSYQNSTVRLFRK